MHLPGADLPGHPAGAGDIGGLDVAGQAIQRGIGDADGIGLVRVRHDHDHRAEDFLLRDPHIGRDAREDRRARIIAVVEAFGTAHAAANQFRPFGDPHRDQFLYLGKLRRIGERAERGRLVQRIGGDDRRGGFGSNRLHFGEPSGGHQHARGRGAGLADIAHRPHHSLGYGTGKIGIFQEDIGRFTAQFLHHPLDRGSGCLRHQHPGAGRSGDRDHIDIGMRRQRCADHFAHAADEVKHPRRCSGIVHYLRKQQRAERRHFAGLDHQGAARRDGRGDLGGDLVHRPIPRRDHGAHADWLAHDLGRAHAGGEFIALQHLGSGAHMRDGKRDLPAARKRNRRAHFRHHGLRELLRAFFQQRFDPAQQRQPFRHRADRKRGERTPRCGHCQIDIRRRTCRDMAEYLLGRRVDHRDLRGIGAVVPLAVDVEARVGEQGGHPVVVFVAGGSAPGASPGQ